MHFLVKTADERYLRRNPVGPGYETTPTQRGAKKFLDADHAMVAVDFCRITGKYPSAHVIQVRVP